MKSLKSLHVFLAAAAAAFLLPACGGGDNDNGDYYISPQQFKSGGKQFLVLTSPRAHFYSDGGQLGDSASAPLTDAWWVSDTTGNSQAAAEFKANGKQNGYIMDGWIECEDTKGTRQRATIAYYVEGGPTGTGYMYVAPNGDVQGNEDALCHMMGCLSPTDVKYAGLTNSMLPYNLVTDEDGDSSNRELYLVPEMQRVLLVSMQGVAFVLQYNFSQAMCKLSLCYAKAYIVQKGSDPETTDNELSEDGTQMDETIEAAVSITRPFVAQPR